ncbi:hypothetical protein AB4Z30_15330 [Paenibacillus sp. 2TAF8]|uniref:hypothetical protein n=1 Tax=Paenibacillus sp. 2TAF8 TaxID=3233020 RepID=UPI003F9C40E2
MNEISLPSSAEHSIESLRMTNTATSVFIEILVLSGSRLAKTNREKEFVIWLAQRDQNRVGRGTVGFELNEMPWLKKDVALMKQFMVNVIHGAMNKSGWHLLDYEPGEEWCHTTLQHFLMIIQTFTAKDIDEQSYLEWISSDEEDEYEPTVPVGHPKCNQHGVYLSCFGCVICNSCM